MRTTEVENMTEREIADMQLWLYHEQTCSRLRKCSFTAFSSCEDFVGNSRTSDEERAQMTTGAYNEVRDRGMRKGDKVSRDGYFQHEAGGKLPPAFIMEVWK